MNNDTLKHKAICISMNQHSINQLAEIQCKTGKSKSRIVRDAIEREYIEVQNGQKKQIDR